MGDQLKYQFLKNLIKENSVIDEILNYTESKFTRTNKELNLYTEEPYIETWQKYKNESIENGVFNTLKKYIVQFKFPIEQNISSTEIYKNATLKGKRNFPLEGLVLNAPEKIELDIYNSKLVGKVPVLIVPNSEDFNSMICALCYKNEPELLSNSMGAIFINGINNWYRIEALKKYWKAKEPLESWENIFKNRVLPNPELFKDKLIILSTKPYSGVKAASVDVSTKSWEDLSVSIRKAHECAHLFTLKYYGSISKNIYDELIADYAGIVSSLKRFDKDWMLHFLGLENYPNYREGGRFQNYLNENLSETAINHLRSITVKAITNIDQFDKALGNIESSNDYLNRIKSLCETDLLSMAMNSGTKNMLKNYHKLTEEVVG